MDGNLRRLVALVSAVVFVDTVFYAAVTPLLPMYAERLDLTKSTAGVLAAGYPAGTLLGALPGGWLAARLGARPVVLLGLGLMTVATVVFGLADDLGVLVGARLVQGLGGACSWAGALVWLVDASPRERRGELIGTAFAAAVAGALLGPVLGAFATAAGTAPAFGLAGAFGLALTVWALLTPPPPTTTAGGLLAGIPTALRGGGVPAGMWVMTLSALLFGVLDVLAPLRLDALGAGALAVSATFLLAAAVEAVLSPLMGRVSDRRGRIGPLRVSLAVAVVVALAVPWPTSPWLVAGLVVAGVPFFGAMLVPAMALVSDAADRARLHQGVAFGLANLAWATGQTVGASAGGTLADATGDAVPYAVVGVLCALTLAASLRRR